MNKELKMTMKEVKEQLILAIGEAFARLTKEKVTGIMSRPVKMKDWLGSTEDDLIPEKLAYNTDEDWISASINSDGDYMLTYFADDGLTFTVTKDDYYTLVHDFVEYFFAIYKA